MFSIVFDILTSIDCLAATLLLSNHLVCWEVYCCVAGHARDEHGVCFAIGSPLISWAVCVTIATSDSPKHVWKPTSFRRQASEARVYNLISVHGLMMINVLFLFYIMMYYIIYMHVIL